MSRTESNGTGNFQLYDVEYCVKNAKATRDNWEVTPLDGEEYRVEEL